RRVGWVTRRLFTYVPLLLPRSTSQYSFASWTWTSACRRDTRSSCNTISFVSERPIAQLPLMRARSPWGFSRYAFELSGSLTGGVDHTRRGGGRKKMLHLAGRA